MKKYVIGIDLGGTKILSAIVDGGGNIICRVKIPTESHLGKNAVIEKLKSSVASLLMISKLSLDDIKAIGIAAPGPILTGKGMILNPPNLPGWKKVPLKAILEKAFRKKIFIENDADAAAVSERMFGAGRGSKNMIYITVSTGIGGGVIIDGKLYRGTVGGAGEAGHMMIKFDGRKCGCGNLGCLEAMASGTSMARIASELLKKNKSSNIPRYAEDGKITALSVELAARAGDKLAKDIIDKEAFYLGIGVSNLVNLFAPDIVVLGGGVMNMADLLLKKIISTVKKCALSPSREHVRIVRAKLKHDVGVLGAAAICLQAQ